HVKFAGAILRADVFDGRIVRLFRYTAVFSGIEPELKDLRIEVVDGHSEVHGVTHAHGHKQNIRKDERMRSLCRGVACEDALFLNARPGGIDHQLKFYLTELLVMKRYKILRAFQLQVVRMKIVRMGGIDGVLHRLYPVALQSFAD